MKQWPDQPPLAMHEGALSDGRTLVSLSGELDLVGAPEFVARVMECLRTGSVLVDLAGLTFMDSSGARALNTLMRESAHTPGDLAVRDEFGESVAQLLRLTGMLGVLPREAAA